MLANNAGVGAAGNFTELNLGAELRMMQLNMGALVARFFFQKVRWSGKIGENRVLTSQTHGKSLCHKTAAL